MVSVEPYMAVKPDLFGTQPICKLFQYIFRMSPSNTLYEVHRGFAGYRRKYVKGSDVDCKCVVEMKNSLLGSVVLMLVARNTLPSWAEQVMQKRDVLSSLSVVSFANELPVVNRLKETPAISLQIRRHPGY